MAGTVESRRNIHESINSLSHETVAQIVKRTFPKISPEKINIMAKRVVSAAHRKVSPRKSGK